MSTPTNDNSGTKPRVAVHKFASCDGCQLALIGLEERLLNLVKAVDIVYFVEARRQTEPGPYDISFVEGSITTPHEADRIQEIRRESKYVVTIGACATAGGIQALRNWKNVKDFAKTVYPNPDYLDTLETSTPISQHIRVDFELRGCPINKEQLYELITALLVGRRPQIPTYSVCLECKHRGSPCVIVSRGVPCLGPVTQAGCGAICPAYNRGCYGCYGPMEAPNTEALGKQMESLGATPAEIMRLFRNFNGYAEVFRIASDQYEELA
jgi:coenzyme F420-reducing hydrogenase gamma subunit